MNTATDLHGRARLITQAFGSAGIAASHIETALIHARAARADLGVLHELETAFAALHRAARRAELQRRRLLRKANRQGVTS